MQRVSVKLPEEMVEQLDARADDDGVTRSDVIRNLLDDGLNTADDARNTADDDGLRRRIEELERKAERLEREKRQILDQREENQELVKYVEQERTLQEERLSASAVTRAKWWLFGRRDAE